MAYSSTQDIVVSTTPQLEGWEVQKYLGPMSSHLVAGTNIFSDIAASFSDLFGGQSKSYRNQLEKINEEVIGQLKEKAAGRGANALIGLQIDNDQISGQGKEMFMVTASATAVQANPTRDDTRPSTGRNTGRPLPLRDMEKEIRKEELLRKQQDGTLKLNEDRWQFLVENGLPEFVDSVRPLAEKLARQSAPSKSRKEDLSRCRDYFLSISPNVAEDYLYQMVAHDNRRVEDWAASVLEDGNMLDLSRISSMLDGDFHEEQKPALEILRRVDKPYYEEADLEKLNEIRGQIEIGFGKRGEVKEIEKSGMMSSGTEKVWQVEGGPENPMERDYCMRSGLDIYGFEEGETRPDEVIDILDRKIQVLERQFSS
jgi:uncharacterized protein YbjQ (UPF0145 family)